MIIASASDFSSFEEVNDLEGDIVLKKESFKISSCSRNVILPTTHSFNSISRYPLLLKLSDMPSMGITLTSESKGMKFNMNTLCWEAGDENVANIDLSEFEVSTNKEQVNNCKSSSTNLNENNTQISPSATSVPLEQNNFHSLSTSSPRESNASSRNKIDTVSIHHGKDFDSKVFGIDSSSTYSTRTSALSSVGLDTMYKTDEERNYSGIKDSIYVPQQSDHIECPTSSSVDSSGQRGKHPLPMNQSCPQFRAIQENEAMENWDDDLEGELNLSHFDLKHSTSSNGIASVKAKGEFMELDSTINRISSSRNPSRNPSRSASPSFGRISPYSVLPMTRSVSDMSTSNVSARRGPQAGSDSNGYISADNTLTSNNNTNSPSIREMHFDPTNQKWISSYSLQAANGAKPAFEADSETSSLFFSQPPLHPLMSSSKVLPFMKGMGGDVPVPTAPKREVGDRTQVHEEEDFNWDDELTTRDSEGCLDSSVSPLERSRASSFLRTRSNSCEIYAGETYSPVISVNGDLVSSTGNFQRYSTAAVFQLDSSLKRSILSCEAEHCKIMATFLGQVEWRKVVERGVMRLSQDTPLKDFQSALSLSRQIAAGVARGGGCDGESAGFVRKDRLNQARKCRQFSNDSSSMSLEAARRDVELVGGKSGTLHADVKSRPLSGSSTSKKRDASNWQLGDGPVRASHDLRPSLYPVPLSASIAAKTKSRGSIGGPPLSARSTSSLHAPAPDKRKELVSLTRKRKETISRSASKCGQELLSSGHISSQRMSVYMSMRDVSSQAFIRFTFNTLVHPNLFIYKITNYCFFLIVCSITLLVDD